MLTSAILMTSRIQKGVQCAYDQPCMRISKDQTEISINVPHNMLVSGPAGGHILPLSEEVKAELFRPQRCGGDDDQGTND